MQMMDTKENKISGIKEKQQLLNLFLYKYFHIFNIILFILVLLFSYIFVINPKYRDITRGVELSNVEKREKLDNMQQFLAKLNRYRQEYYEISPANIERLNAMLPEGTDIESMYTEIASLVKQRGLTLSSLEVTPEDRTTSAQIKKSSANEGQVGEIKLNMQVSGADYDAFKKLVLALENNLRLINIDKVSYSPADMTIGMEAVSYYLK